MPSTIKLHRVLRGTPERVYKAFTNADAMAKWLPPYGFTCHVSHLEARVGGTFRMACPTSFLPKRAISAGRSHSSSSRS